MGSTPKATQSPAGSPAKGKAGPLVLVKAAAKGVAKRTAKKPAPKKGGTRGKGRGQKKAYDEPRAQAAYERQRELRDLYSQVSLAIKPALDEIADRTLKMLIEDPDAHKEVEEYFAVQRQLDEQLELVIERSNLEYQTRVGITRRTFELDNDLSQKKYMV